MQSTGFIVDLTGLQFEEGGRKTWIHALPLGTYKHPLYGTIKVTRDRITRLADNVKSMVRGQQLDIDYDHKQYSGKAAGWVEDAEPRDNGLWIKVEWTEDAKSAIDKGEYKYFSPEFADEWKDPKTEVVHKDVLFGGGITNRPFLKDLLPMNMSEYTDREVKQVDKFLEALRKALKLSDTATEEEILAAAAAAEPEEEKEEETKEEEETEEEPEVDEKALSELIASNPIIGTLVKQNKKLTEQVTTLAVSHKLGEVNTLITGWSSNLDGHKFALPPAVHDDLRTVMLAEPNSKLVEVIDHILQHGLVELGERGGDRNDPSSNGNGGSAIKKFTDLVSQKMKADNTMSFMEAAGKVAGEDPDLFEAYRAESLTDPKGV